MKATWPLWRILAFCISVCLAVTSQVIVLKYSFSQSSTQLAPTPAILKRDSTHEVYAQHPTPGWPLYHCSTIAASLLAHIAFLSLGNNCQTHSLFVQLQSNLSHQTFISYLLCAKHWEYKLLNHYPCLQYGNSIEGVWRGFQVAGRDIQTNKCDSTR